MPNISDKNMYEPREDSFLLEKHVKNLAFGNVLDIGTGLGIQAKAALMNKKVKNVIASDIDKKAIERLEIEILKNKNLHKKGNAKIKVIRSDLFSNIKGSFDTIIFNPPYLPDSDYDNDKSLGGGKKGFELLEKFINQVSNFLEEKGIVLIVFSSITGKKIIDDAIKDNLLEFEILEKKRIFFEDLYVYKITKTALLKKIQKNKIKDIKFFMKGHRGIIFKAKLNKKDVAVKIKRPESKAIGRIENEINFLKKLNQKNIGPKLLIGEDDFFAYEFLDGDMIINYLKKNRENIKNIKDTLKKVLKQMYILDSMKIMKEEMHHPLKHIIIKGNFPILIDFERCHYSEKPGNTTQFIQFIISLNEDFKLGLKRDNLIKSSKEYKKNYTKKRFDRIIDLIDQAICS